LTGWFDGMMMPDPRVNQARAQTNGDVMTTPQQPTAFARRGEARRGLAS
jgi:hypothetical protein